MAEFWNSVRDLAENILYTFSHMDLLRDGLDILMISVVVYELIMLMRETRAAQLFKGILVLGAIYLLTVLMGLTGMKFILDNFFFYIIVIVVVIFQPELRRMLEHMGQSSRIPVLGKLGMRANDEKHDEVTRMVDTLCSAAEMLSSTKTGALVVIERSTKLGDIIQSGTVLDATMSVSLLGNIFYTGSPLHDGAVIVRDCKVYAAGCFLPLMQRMDHRAHYGTRHRAAIGMSENSDALVVVVSEETGTISLARAGRLERDFDKESLKKVLLAYLTSQTETVEQGGGENG
ncbi:MAG: diadenylate cyclase CdaA [Oscillospiraceae bacterium]|nr:diadenylate cyclase CdaA [Oscillospiraceae bacterium]MBQ4102217.1 diadenylate cyclase CdaA [Oscillospiraceae bacterium]